MSLHYINRRVRISSSVLIDDWNNKFAEYKLQIRAKFKIFRWGIYVWNTVFTWRQHVSKFNGWNILSNELLSLYSQGRRNKLIERKLNEIK